jgi:ATP-dependent helicase YprA (DUF1998 family)
MTEFIKAAPLIEELNRRTTRAVIGQLGLRSVAATRYLNSVFESLPGEKGSFFASPLFEATFGWKEANLEISALEGGLFSKEILAALNSPPTTPEDLSEYQFPLDRHPYEHQLEAWQHLLCENKDGVLLVADY